MKVLNQTSYPIIAICWHRTKGSGREVTIPPGSREEVLGPYIGEIDGGPSYLILMGEVICHEGPDDRKCFQVTREKQLNLGAKGTDSGITIRHHLEELKFESKPEDIDSSAPKISKIATVSRSEHLGWIKPLWPDKDKIVAAMTRTGDILSRDWPPYPIGAVRNLWVNFGRKIERAQKPEECVDALFEVLKYLSCPEPGWEGIELNIVD